MMKFLRAGREKKTCYSISHQNDSLYLDLTKVTNNIDKCAESIRDCQMNIIECQRELASTVIKADRERLLDDKKMLMEKEKMLMEKENMLRYEKKMLMEKENMLMEKEKDEKKLFLLDPRSLFVDSVVPPPRPYQSKSFKFSDFQYSLQFVDRNRELVYAWNALIGNHAHGPKRKLLFTGQMFGSGKTRFGENLLNWEDPRIRRLFESSLVLMDPEAKKKLKSALTVSIDIGNHNYQGETMDLYISKMIFVETMYQYFETPKDRALQFWLRSSLPSNRCYALLESLTKRPLFIHFDEMNALEGKFFPSSSPSSSMLLESSQKELKLYYDFWRVVHVLQGDGAFVYLTGKSLVMNDIGMKMLGEGQSPSAVAPLYLSLFTPRDIESILWDSNANLLTEVGKCLLLSDSNNRQKVSQWIHRITSGIPRFVEYSLDYMIKSTFSTPIDWEHYPEEKILTVIAKAPGASPVKQNNPALNALVTLAVYEIPFTVDTILEGTTHTIADAASAIGFFIDISSEGLMTLILPLLWRHNMTLPSHLEPLRNISPAFMDKGKALENCVEASILYRCNVPIKTSDSKSVVSSHFPELLNTSVANEIISEIKLSRMDEKVTARNFDCQLRSLMMQDLSSCILVRASDRSHMPDLMILLPSLIPNDRLIIGWAVKNYPNTPLGLSVIIKESCLFVKAMSTLGCRGGLLVIVVNGKGTAAVESLRGRLLKSDDALPKGLVFPSNMQVLVLSQKQVQRFLGQEVLLKLSM
jgi:hypothetical protein